MPTHDTRSLAVPVTHAAIDDAVGRTVAIAGLTGIALIHVLQLPDAFSETFYLGLLFVGAVVGAVLVAAALTRTSTHRVWSAACALGALVLLGYLLSRTTGLPGATDDVGEWDEPLGLASMVAESLVVCVSAVVLASRRSVPVAATMPGTGGARSVRPIPEPN
jgi:Na+/proline symporter